MQPSNQGGYFNLTAAQWSKNEGPLASEVGFGDVGWVPSSDESIEFSSVFSATALFQIPESINH